MDSTTKRLRKALPEARDIRALEAFFVDGKILITAAGLADFFNVGRRSISLWQKRGLTPEVSKNGLVALFDLNLAIKWNAENVSQKHSAWGKGEKSPKQSEENLPPVDPATIDLATASIETLDRLKAIEDVTNKRLKNAKERGDLVPAEDLDRAMAEQGVLHVTYYMDDLESLPAALAGKTEAQISAFLEPHYARRIENAHTFISKVFDAPDWLFRKIKELMDAGE